MDNKFEAFAMKEMRKYLIGIGIFPNTVGYSALLAAAIIYARRLKEHVKFTEIYAHAAKRTGRSSAAIERGIRNAILRSYHDKRIGRIRDYFEGFVFDDDYPIRASELISLFAIKLNEDYSNYIES